MEPRRRGLILITRGTEEKQNCQSAEPQSRDLNPGSP